MRPIFPRPPKTLPLQRTYYYQDGSTTRLIQQDPLEIERQPKDRTLRWKRSQWSLRVWTSRIHWPLTLDAWTLENAPVIQETGLRILPDTWTTVAFKHGYGTLAYAFASPYGHLFACPSLGSPPILLPYPSPAPQHDDAVNILRANLGDTFYCYRCTHRHRTNSASLDHCQSTTPTQLNELAGRTKKESFSTQIQSLNDRVQWYRYNQQITHEMNTAWHAFHSWVESYALDRTVPLIRPAELAAAGGLHAYHLRIQNWRMTNRAEYLRRDEAITQRGSALESLIPPPHAIGPPRRTEAHALTLESSLTSDTRHEIARIQEALSQFICTIDYQLEGMRLTFTRPQRIRTTHSQPLNELEFWRALEQAFSIKISSVTCEMNTTTRWIHTVDILGLDPQFWQFVTFTRQKLVFTTHRTQCIHHQNQPHPLAPQLLTSCQSSPISHS